MDALLLSAAPSCAVMAGSCICCTPPEPRTQDDDSVTCHGLEPGRPEESVDFCQPKQELGARMVTRIQDGERLIYEVEVNRPGTYQVLAGIPSRTPSPAQSP